MISPRQPLAVLALAVLTACGGGGGDAPQPDQPAPPAAPAPPPAAAASGDTITIQMVTTQSGAAGQFQPAQVTAKPGDVLRFVSDGGAAHNVSFPAAENAGAAGLPAPTAYTVAAGQATDVPVTLAPGTYTFQCDPHTATGMKGTLTVTG